MFWNSTFEKRERKSSYVGPNVNKEGKIILYRISWFCFPKLNDAAVQRRLKIKGFIRSVCSFLSVVTKICGAEL